MAHAKQPNIVSGQRRSTLRIREIVIKVEVIGCATQYASTLVALVHLTLDGGGNHAIVDEIRGRPVPSYEFNFIISKEKSEFEYFAGPLLSVQASTSSNTPLYVQIPSLIFS